MNQNQELNSAIERIASGSPTDYDLHIYNHWCNSLQGGKENTLPDFEFTRKAMFQQINKEISRKSLLKVTYSCSGIAAAIIIAFFVVRALLPGGWNFSKHTPTDISMLRHNIPAGFNIATLKLSTGKIIALDNRVNGPISEQVGIMASKTSGDALVYAVLTGKSGRSPVNTAGKLMVNTLSTSKARQYQLNLPDGTHVWLNAASSIRFPVNFTGLGERRVELEGEAYFEVAKDAHKPFIVHSNGQDVKVLGTHFNVNNYHDDSLVKTTLLEGSISISERLVLHPGYQSQLDKTGKITAVKVDPFLSASWRNGNFDFDNENVFEIMRRLSRWYDIEVIYQGKIPLDKMKGRFSKKQAISKILDVIGSTGLLKIRMIGKKIYIKKF
ncbi:DUF4974 domain-containing protein [Pedobacter sp. HDW13]|uniref:FecR family protein n=1 Tax=Pedobacter sp. HDW13 TaxID=2714940 RepID=UPI00140942E6|nr:FecR family protein [Pedobacter sp. HDW13]QIL37917.1 DUF4974 domain-containing protein [Pedobacter sp. HDW13]